jgi:RNA-directed DNA polymerase
MNGTNERNRVGAQTPESLSTKLNRLSETARKDPEFQFKNIAHLMSVEMLIWSFGQLRKNAAAGVDGITAKDYETNLHANVTNLHQQLVEGRYRAQPLRRVYIEKEDGKKRPLSIPALEDKIVQRAATELLNRIYENDFLPVSYGYRPNRSAHDALEAISTNISMKQANYVLDADISDYFGSIVRSQLMKMLQKRIGDKHLLALIGKWLNVGVIEEGRLLMSENGTYQGSIISPVLANLYLHEVLDRWFEKEVKPRLRGEAFLYRYADDLVATFQFRQDAERFMRVLIKRFEKFGLKLHPEKTKLIEFGRTAWRKSQKTGIKPQTFNFLGLTHYCGTSRKGKFNVKVKTMAKRLARGIKRVKELCMIQRHNDLSEQHQRLQSILYGHYAYYGRRSNYRSLMHFFRGIEEIWKKWLCRRSKNGYVTWDKMKMILRKYPLPKPRIVHGPLGTRSQIPLYGEFI